MKPHFGLSIVKTLLQGAVEVLMSIPLLLLLAVYAWPGAHIWIWIGTLPLLFAAGYTLIWLLGISRLAGFYLLAAALGCIHAWLVIGTDEWLWWLAIPVGILVAFRGSRLIVEQWYMYFPSGFYIVGMVLYGLESLIGSHIPELAPVMPILLWGGLIALAVTLLMVNQSNVKQEAFATVKNNVLSLAVQWQNRLFVLALFAAVLVAATLHAIERAIFWLFHYVIYAIISVLALLTMFAGDAPERPEIDPKPLEFEQIHSEPSWWWDLLQKWGIWISTGLIVIVGLFVAYFLGKRVVKTIKWLYKWLKRFINRHEIAAGSSYVDDVENLMGWKELGGRWSSSLQQWLRRKETVSWGDLTDNGQRIRYLYRSLLLRSTRKGYDFKPYLTPAETERDLLEWGRSASAGQAGVLIKLYERVRYGRDAAVKDDEVEQAKAAIDKR